MKKLFTILIVTLISSLTVLCDAQINNILNFNGTNGASPSGSLTLSGKMLFGMTTDGGANNLGCIFSIDTNGTGYKDLFDFSGANGKYPQGSLTLSGNILYGMTYQGGTHDSGCIFSIDTNGTGFNVIFNFSTATGAQPGGGSLSILGNVLYGMTEAGESYNEGVIFSINTNGSGFTILHVFNDTTGAQPRNNLTLYGTTLYGVTLYGGEINGFLHSFGVIFSINTNGSGFTILHNFNDTLGWEPWGGVTLVGNKLFGMTYNGGAFGSGIIYSINTDGSGFKDLNDFASLHGNPIGSLTLSGSKLYGMTSDGYLFYLDTNGGGYTEIYELFKANDIRPWGNVIFSGNIMYGMTTEGGIHNDGVIFSFKDTSNLTSVNSLYTPLSVVTLYPNPDNGQFTILNIGNINQQVNFLEIYNLLGEKIYTSTFNTDKLEINLNNEPSGIYLYQVINENGESAGSGKFVIQY